MRKIVHRLHYTARLQYFDQNRELLSYDDVTKGDIDYDGLLVLPLIFADRKYIRPGTYNGRMGGVVYAKISSGLIMPAINVRDRTSIVPYYNDGHAYISFHIPKNKEEITVWLSEKPDFKDCCSQVIDLTEGF